MSRRLFFRFLVCTLLGTLGDAQPPRASAVRALGDRATLVSPDGVVSLSTMGVIFCATPAARSNVSFARRTKPGMGPMPLLPATNYSL